MNSKACICTHTCMLPVSILCQIFLPNNDALCFIIYMLVLICLGQFCLAETSHCFAGQSSVL